MEFHAPSFGDDFGLNQYASAVATGTVTPTADVVTTSYYVPSTQSYVHTNAGLYQTTTDSEMMSFGTHELWSPTGVTQVQPYQQQQQQQQQYTNLNVQGMQNVHMAQQTGHLQGLQVVTQQQQQAQPTAQIVTQPQTTELTRESSPMAGSPDSYGTSSGGGPIKKQKQAKKKKDPNEPKKPLSAYAMFFRDTQAAIKGQNPSASFGEVSKIVASMWESLEADKKNSYKQKAEDAKKDYLKALTAYKANLVAQGAGSQDNSIPSPPQPAQPPTPVSVPQTSTPSTFSQTVMIEQHHPAQWAAQQMAQQPQQPVQIIYAQHSNVQHLQAGGQLQQAQNQHNGLPALPDYHLSNAGGQMTNQLHTQYGTTLNVQVPNQVLGQVGQVQMVTQVSQQQHLGTVTSQPLQTQAGQSLVHMTSSGNLIGSQSQPMMTSQSMVAPQAVMQQQQVPAQNQLTSQQPQQQQQQQQMVQQMDSTGMLTPPVSAGSQPSHSPQAIVSTQVSQPSQQQVLHAGHQAQVQQQQGQQQQQQQQQVQLDQQRQATTPSPGVAPAAEGNSSDQQLQSPAAVSTAVENAVGQETKEAFNQQQQRLAAQEAASVNGTLNNNNNNNNNEPLTPKENDEASANLCSHKPMCRRKGCGKAAVECAEWDKEYCSNECVVSHCREVFSSWVGQRQTGQATTGPPVVSQ